MSKATANPPLVITRVCPYCGRRIISRNGAGRRESKCPSCKAVIAEPLITLVGTTPARRKKGHKSMLQLIGACHARKKNIAARHDNYLSQ